MMRVQSDLDETKVVLVMDACIYNHCRSEKIVRLSVHAKFCNLAELNLFWCS